MTFTCPYRNYWRNITMENKYWHEYEPEEEEEEELDALALAKAKKEEEMLEEDKE